MVPIDIPNNVTKFMVLIGIGLIIYSFITSKSENEKYSKENDQYKIELKRLEIENNNLNKNLKDINHEAEILSKKNHLKNPLTISDSGYLLIRTIIGSKIEITLSDTIKGLLKKYDETNAQLIRKGEELELKKYQIDLLTNYNNEVEEQSLMISAVGGLFLILGFYAWLIEERKAEILLRRQNLDKPTSSSNCQSCGKIFNSFIEYGTVNEQLKNYHYCSSCYLDGKFVEPNLSLQQLIIRTGRGLIENKYSKLKRRSIIKKIKNLDRWKIQKY